MGILADIRVRGLIEKLLSAKDANSEEAKKAFSKLKDLAEEAVPKLVETLGTVDGEQRARLSALLAVSLSNQTLPLYIDGISSSNPRTAEAMIAIMTKSRAFDPNRLLLHLSRKDVTEAALIKVLQAHKDRLRGKDLLNMASKLDPVRQGPLFAIVADIATPELIPDLVARASAKEATMRMNVSRILARFDTAETREALSKLLADPQKAVRLSALRGVASMSSRPDIEPIIELLHDPDFNVQNLAIEIIVKWHDPETLEKIFPLITDEAEHVRRAGVEILNILGTPDAVSALLAGLRDRDWWVRERAADALVKIGGPKVVRAMTELIKSDDEFIRRTAVEVLAATHDESAFDQLLDSLGDADWWVRERAIDALASIGDARAAPFLRQALHKDTHTRIVAIRALGKLGDTSAIRDIKDCLTDPEPAVVKQALETLGQITDQVFAFEVTEAIRSVQEGASAEVREAADGALRAIKGRLGESRLASAASGPPGDTGERSAIMPAPTAHVGLDTLQPEKLQPGQVLAGRYEMVKRIGKGAFGTVILFEDVLVAEKVVLKFINPQYATDPQVRQRFVHEIRYARRVTHPNVIRIHDILALGEAAAISMEYFPGHALADELKDEKPLDLKRARDIILQVTAGLAAAHKEGIIHRDLKPANILINEAGLTKVVDFGIAAAGGNADTRLTRTGMVVGTPTYLAPEQVQGKPIDQRTDIYSMGILMYQMLSGSPPYKGPDAISLMYQHVQGNATPLHIVNPDIPKTLSAVVHKAMAVDPAKRYQTMEELHDQFQKLSLD